MVLFSLKTFDDLGGLHSLNNLNTIASLYDTNGFESFVSFNELNLFDNSLNGVSVIGRLYSYYSFNDRVVSFRFESFEDRFSLYGLFSLMVYYYFS